MVVGGARVKNNMHSYKEDFITHGCAPHQCRDKLQTAANLHKWRNCFLLLVSWRFANKLIAYCHLLFWGVYYISKHAQNDITNVKADQQEEGGGAQSFYL